MCFMAKDQFSSFKFSPKTCIATVKKCTGRSVAVEIPV